MKRLIALGCSLTKDNFQKTWANYLSEYLKLECVNIGARGAGIDFLSTRLVAFDLKSSDLVGIMLPSADRFDWYIDKGNSLQRNALNIASWQNGKNSNLVGINGELSNTTGFVLSGGEHRGEKALWFKYFYSEYKARLDFWKSVHYMQLYLESHGIHYFFTSVYDKDKQIEQDVNKGLTTPNFDIIDKINFNKFVYYKNELGFLSFCNDNNYKRVNDYPITEAHEHYVKQYLIPGVKV